MSSALYRWGRTFARHPRSTLAAWGLAILILGAVVGLAGGDLSDDYQIPGSQSQTAMDTLAARFPDLAGAQAQLVVVVPPGTASQELPTRVARLVETLRGLRDVAEVTDPYDPTVTGALDATGRAALVDVQLSMDRENISEEVRRELVDAAARERTDGVRVEVGGPAFGVTAQGPTALAGVGVLVALLVLVLTLGSARAAGVPLASALSASAVSLAVILALTAVTRVSSAAPLFALMIGLAVGLDYALLVVSRHRENLASGLPPDEAAARAVATGGAAVVLAGGTVVIALLALAIARVPVLSVMGVAAAVAVAAAALGAVTLLPALLAAAGTRLTPAVRRPRPRRAGRGRPSTSAPRPRLAERWVALVMLRPAVTVLVVVLGLAALALPAKDLRLALPGPLSAGPQTTERRAADLVTEYFSAGHTGLLLVTADLLTVDDPQRAVEALAADLGAMPGVATVSVATTNPSADTGVVELVPTTGPSDPRTADLVTAIRNRADELQSRYGTATAVTGTTAVQIDASNRLAGALVPFGVVVVGLTLVLLAAAFRSVVIPLTAALGYVLSVGAAFGVVAAVFEWGWAADLLRVPRSGPVVSFLPIVLMGVLFGLAMDYQVIIGARVREHLARTGDAAAALAGGVAQAAPVVVTASAIMVAVFAAFVATPDPVLQPVALALAVGVAVDAFVVRLALVPAVLALAGRRAWWLPARLDHLLPAVDVEGKGLQAQLAAADRLIADPGRGVIGRGLRLNGPAGVVFEGIDVTARRGQVCVLAGPAGSGKTSLLLALAGRMDLHGGRLEVVGLELPRSSGDVRRRVALAETVGVNDLDLGVTVGQHVAERVAALTSRPLTGGGRIDAVLAGMAHALAAGAVGSGAPPAPTPGRGELVAHLAPLQRMVLGIALALVGEPRVVAVDDVDALRNPADRVAAWRVLAWLAHRNTADCQPFTVLATCQDPAEVRALALPDVVVVDVTRSVEKVS